MGDLKDRLVARALEEGFDGARICRPWDVGHVPDGLAEYLARGYHGQMGWMESRSHWRGNPSVLWPEAKSVIMLAESYAPESDPRAGLAHKDRGVISVYARGKDYHDLVKKRLKRLARWLIGEAESEARKLQGRALSSNSANSTATHSVKPVVSPEVKVFVDTAPVPEKALGQAAGLGWQGKHSNLVSRDWGNWAFIGSVFTTLDLPVDAPEVDHCGSCRACLDVCPTEAFVAPYQLDARRCISYLTIEHKGPVDLELRARLGNRIYGCDDCLAVCPWNKYAVAASDLRYASRPGMDTPRLSELAVLDDAQFRAMFAGSPVKRVGRDRFVRNVLYAIGNSRDPALREVAGRLVEDPDETVADAARWACGRLD